MQALEYTQKVRRDIGQAIEQKFQKNQDVDNQIYFNFKFRKRFAEKFVLTNIDLLVLLMVSSNREEWSYGYGIIKGVGQTFRPLVTNGISIPSYPVYSRLDELTELGYFDKQKVGRRVTYRITAKGRKAKDSMMKQMKNYSDFLSGKKKFIPEIQSVL